MCRFGPLPFPATVPPMPDGTPPPIGPLAAALACAAVAEAAPFPGEAEAFAPAVGNALGDGDVGAPLFGEGGEDVGLPDADCPIAPVPAQAAAALFADAPVPGEPAPGIPPDDAIDEAGAEPADALAPLGALADEDCNPPAELCALPEAKATPGDAKDVPLAEEAPADAEGDAPVLI
jgi:hypothetical protein